MNPNSGENSTPKEPRPPEEGPFDWASDDEWEVIAVEDWVMSEEDLVEQEIQARMYREGARAVREEVAWLEEHNFPIWIYHEGKVVDARTLSDEERAKATPPETDIYRPAFLRRRRGCEENGVTG